MSGRYDLRLSRDSFGKLIFTDVDGISYSAVVPVRAFPITAPQQDIAIVSNDGHELTWIPHLDQLPESVRLLVQEELSQREFMPEICRIVSVSSYTTPSIWNVETDRGISSFTLKGEDDIRRLAPPALLIASSHGIEFLIRDRSALESVSRKILDRFL
jgi:hypothetical protein